MICIVTEVVSHPCGINATSSSSSISVVIAPRDEFNSLLYKGWSPFDTPLTISSSTAGPRLQFFVVMGEVQQQQVQDDFTIGIGFVSNDSRIFVNLTVAGPALGRATLPSALFLGPNDWHLVAFWAATSGGSAVVNFSSPITLLPYNITVIDSTATNASAAPGLVRFNDDASMMTSTLARPRCVTVGGTLPSFVVEVVDSSLLELYVTSASITCVAKLVTVTGALAVSGTTQVSVSPNTPASCVFSGLEVDQFGVGAQLTVNVVAGKNNPIGSASMPVLISRFPTPQCYLGFNLGSPSWLSLGISSGGVLPSLISGARLPQVVVSLYASDSNISPSAGLTASVTAFMEDGTSSGVLAVAAFSSGTAVFKSSITIPSLAPVGSKIQLVFTVQTSQVDVSLVSRQIVIASPAAAGSVAFALFDLSNVYFSREGQGAIVDASLRIARIRVFAKSASGANVASSAGSAALLSPARQVISSCSLLAGSCTFTNVGLPAVGVYSVVMFNGLGQSVVQLRTGFVQLTTRDGVVAAAFAPWGSLFTRELQQTFCVIGSPLPAIRILLLDRFGNVVRGENQLIARATSLGGQLSWNIAAAIGGEVVFTGLTIRSCDGLCTITFVFDELNLTLTTGAVVALPDDSASIAAVEFADSGLSLIRSKLDVLEPVTVSGSTNLPPVAIGLVLANHMLVQNTTVSVTCTAGPNITKSPITNGSSVLLNIAFSPGPALPWSSLSCCLDPSLSAVQRCAAATLLVSSSPVASMFVSDAVVALGSSGPIQESMYGSVLCGSGLCTSFPASNVTVSVATPFSLRTSVGSASNYSQSIGIQNGMSDVVNLVFSQASDIPADKALSVTFTSTADSTVVGGSSAFTVGTLAVDPASILDLIVALPPAAFSPSIWLNSFAAFLALDPARLQLRRTVQSFIADAGLSGTRLEISVGQPTNVVPQLTSSADITNQIAQMTPTCQNSFLNLALVWRHSAVSSRCDAASFSEIAESSLHCEIFNGPTARCSCFVHLMYFFGDACVHNAELTVVCAHLGGCNDPKIKSVCSQIQANIPLQVLFVVGGTALGMLILFALFRVRQAPKLATRVFVHQNAQNVLLLKKGKNADDIVFH